MKEKLNDSELRKILGGKSVSGLLNSQLTTPDGDVDGIGCTIFGGACRMGCKNGCMQSCIIASDRLGMNPTWDFKCIGYFS